MANNSNPSLFNPSTSTFVFTLNGDNYMGLGDDGYCTVVQNISKAQRFRAYPYNNKMYYKVTGGAWDGEYDTDTCHYLSAYDNGQVGVWKWSGSIDWTLSGGHLTTNYFGNAQSIKNNGGLVYLTDSNSNLLQVTQEWPWPDYSGWMKALQDKLGDPFCDVPLFQLPIPGSHDSGTYGMGMNARTQNLTIADQLMLGIRFFDLRPRVNNGVYYLHHGPIGTENLLAKWPFPADLETFPCVLLDIRRFLEKNPKEVVILKFQSFDGHNTDNFNPDDHIAFRTLLNDYLSLVPPSPVSALTLNSIFKDKVRNGGVIVFYDNVGSMAGGPGPGDSTWNNIWPFLTDGDQQGSSKYIRIWDPFWDDTSHSLGNEGIAQDGKTVFLTDRWKTYHNDNLIGWQTMKLARFFVTQAQMQVAQPTGMDVSGYFSKVEKSAITNNHLNIDLFADWMAKGVPSTSDPGAARLPLRPNVLSLDFVEFGSLCEKIIAFFESLSPSDFKQQYPFSTSFIDPVDYPTHGTLLLALGQNRDRYVGADGGFATSVGSTVEAKLFRMVINNGKLYFLVVGSGDLDAAYLSLMERGQGLDYHYNIVWNDLSERTAWKFDNGKLLCVKDSAYLQVVGSALVADPSRQQEAVPVSLVWL